MPSSKKEIPNARKRVTASARARTSVKKQKRMVASELDGSYVQKSKKTVSTACVKEKQQPVSHPDNEAILSILKDIKESNDALSKRMDKVERQAARDSTPINPRSHAFDHRGISLPNSPQQPSQSAGMGDQMRDHMNIHDFRQQYPQPATVAGPHHGQGQPTRQHQSSQGMEHMTYTRDNAGQLPDRHDAVIPSIQNLRGNPGISEAVNNLLASYEGNLQSELARGKPTVKKSGRYNTHDSVVAPPHLRWPNEGFHSSNGKKRVVYDELSLPQWVAGQLCNIHSISDPVLVKQALSQVIFTMRDATSLPWPAVRTAWASSMHEVEEGHLSWADATQWAINRLSSSQIAMAHTQVSNQPSTGRRPCKFFNEGSCTHENHHGSYSHFCTYCSKQGKNFPHPESKCTAKHRQGNKQPQASN